MLFKNETFNISKIESVICYEPRNHKKYSYSGTLPTYELMYYEKGKAELNFGGKTYNSESDSIIFLPRGIKNADYTLKIKEPPTVYNIYFQSEDPLPDEAVMLNNKSGEIKNLFSKLYRTWFAKKDGYYYKAMRYTYNIIELIRKQQTGYNSPSKLSCLEPCEEYIYAHYCDYDFSYQELLSLSGLSYSYFKKLFIDKHGMPPVKYISRLKIIHACELLKSEKYRVNEIAQLCGFDNTYYFSNFFKKHIGLSPLQYIKAEKGKKS